MTHVLPVCCQDCQFLEWPVCTAPFLCWGMLKEFAEEKEAPACYQHRGHSEMKRHSQWQRQGNYERK